MITGIRSSTGTNDGSEYGEEVSSAWNPIAAIIRHLRSMHGRGERRNAVRCSALRLLLSQSPDNDLNPVEIEPRPRQPGTGYKRPKLWVSALYPRPFIYDAHGEAKGLTASSPSGTGNKLLPTPSGWQSATPR
jgi:hypothetical protein